MKVPYAKKWQNETDALRKTSVGCGLVEAVKWGKPCFTYQKKNVAIVIPLKETCALAFFKGALLKDPKRILKKIGQQQAGRWIKFTALKDIAALRPTSSVTSARPSGSRRREGRFRSREPRSM